MLPIESGGQALNNQKGGEQWQPTYYSQHKYPVKPMNKNTSPLTHWKLLDASTEQSFN